uniref:Uncharacterized protein n=1 Tax=Meloidogyne enterolobii TaxID=390850 RepID=A0A6V7Y3G1_MELEN|nr:unnamed protein product [Meloidogyne enterolobii]
MKIVRCWLEKLFLCNFQYSYFEDYFFNPEMIKILFDNEKNIQAHFRTDFGLLTYYNHNIKNLLKFNLEHLIVNYNLQIIYKPLDKNEKYNKRILKLLFNAGKNIRKITISLEKQTIFDLIIKHIEIKDCSNIISDITIINEIKLSQYHARSIEEKPILIITNTNNPKMVFKIYCNDKVEYASIFKIKKDNSTQNFLI